MTVLQALQHPKVLFLAAAYFFVVTASYGVEFFLPSILENWYDLPLSNSPGPCSFPRSGGWSDSSSSAGVRIAPASGGFTARADLPGARLRLRVARC